MSENQYVVGLPSKVSWKIWMTQTDSPNSGSTVLQRISSTNNIQKIFKWSTFLQKYFWAERFSVS